MAIHGLEKSWASVCELKLRVTQVESNPQLVQIVPPNEVIVLISFEITMGEMRGIMNLCIPVQHDRADDRKPVVRHVVGLHEAGQWNRGRNSICRRGWERPKSRWSSAWPTRG